MFSAASPPRSPSTTWPTRYCNPARCRHLLAVQVRPGESYSVSSSKRTRRCVVTYEVRPSSYHTDN